MWSIDLSRYNNSEKSVNFAAACVDYERVERLVVNNCEYL
jgi:hypothetical protein